MAFLLPSSRPPHQGTKGQPARAALLKFRKRQLASKPRSALAKFGASSALLLVSAVDVHMRAATLMLGVAPWPWIAPPLSSGGHRRPPSEKRTGEVSAGL
jgi:hypothetical protein